MATREDREDIREGVGERLAVMDNLIYSGMYGEAKERNDYNVSTIMSYLHSQGVVLKVERELPKDPAGENTIPPGNHCTYLRAQQDM